MNLQDVVKRLEQGSRIPDPGPRQRTIAWVRFFSEVDRSPGSEGSEADRHDGPHQQSGAA